MEQINMLPRELQRGIKADRRQLLKRIAAATMAAVLLAAYGVFCFHTHALQQEIAAAEKELARRQTELTAAAGSERQWQQERLALQDFQYLLEKRQAWSPLLEAIDAGLPVDVWLERISIAGMEPGAPAAGDGQAPGAPVKTPPGRAVDGTVPGGETGSHGTAKALWPPADTLVVNGYSRTVPSVGVFMYRLGRMPGLQQITLNEISEAQKYAAYRFKITVAIGGSGG